MKVIYYALILTFFPSYVFAEINDNYILDRLHSTSDCISLVLAAGSVGLDRLGVSKESTETILGQRERTHEFARYFDAQVPKVMPINAVTRKIYDSVSVCVDQTTQTKTPEDFTEKDKNTYRLLMAVAAEFSVLTNLAWGLSPNEIVKQMNAEVFTLEFVNSVYEDTKKYGLVWPIEVKMFQLATMDIMLWGQEQLEPYEKRFNDLHKQQKKRLLDGFQIPQE